MNITKPRYEAPQAEIIALEHQSVLCASGGGNAPGGSGAGITGMNGGNTYGW